jgi:hypothetical protein
MLEGDEQGFYDISSSTNLKKSIFKSIKRDHKNVFAPNPRNSFYHGREEKKEKHLFSDEIPSWPES